MTTLYNPMLNGFHPDPSVVKVGDEWFLATSTFEYLPGIPIHRSRDFETWELIGHVSADPDVFGIADVPTAGGVWAPDRIGVPRWAGIRGRNTHEAAASNKADTTTRLTGPR